MHATYSLEKNILKTIAYYQALNGLTLTPLEIQKYLTEKELRKKATLFDIHTNLNKLKKKGMIKEIYGFWMLSNSNNISHKNRIQNSKYTAFKWKKFAKTGRFLPYIPFVRSIAITGSMALNNAKAKSDIDILIITKSNSIWNTRFFITCASFILKKRRYGKKIEDRLCFNQYTTTNAGSFGPKTIDKTVKNIKIPVWDSKKSTKNEAVFSFKPIRVLLFIKKLIEKFLIFTYLDKITEFLLGNLQIIKIRSNPIDYPRELQQPSLLSKNLIFYYPKVKLTEQNYKKIIRELSVPD